MKLKNSWYNIFRGYVKLGLYFTLKKIEVHGKENIPKKGAILFIGNHQNALIDAILIPTTNSRNIHFLTRASAFKNNYVDRFLRSLNLIPIYRIRDGKNSIEKNSAVFEQCFDLLNKQKAIEIFAEGEHHLFRRVIPLKKGFARIILGTLQKYPDVQIQIVPVGINYDSRLNFPSSASVYYGKPILANPYFNLNEPDYSFKEILKKVKDALQELTLHVADEHNHDAIIKKLEQANVNYLNPIEANKMAKNSDNLRPVLKPTKINWLLPIQLLAKLNSLAPLLIWYYLKPKIYEKIFTNTFRFALIVTVFPLFYLLQTWLIFHFFNGQIAVIYFASTILLGYISVKTMPIST